MPDYARVVAVFHAAAALDASTRRAFLDAECVDDAALRAEVESLLAADQAAGEFLELPAAILAGLPSPGEPLPPADSSCGRIGPYTLLQILGEGGMGVVYLAEQQQPLRRKVALKLLKSGIDNRQVAARFESERQALAMMNHANIAKVFDAGTSPDGRPYFVMEHVSGVAITEYCDAHRLSNRERLELFLPVCRAVQHAHQKGVIHRDLKPSNILVAVEDGRPVPKVIDFGIAKATEASASERQIFTQQGVLVGTPEYMSPEQTDSTRQAVDTTTDIYSLGVVLYELLVGTLPFDPEHLRRAAYEEMLRIIREQPPPRPSVRLTTMGPAAEDIARRRDTDIARLRKEVRGELDWITLKAMEKDRARRYASVSELAADIERHLHDEPVSASPPSTAYRLQKSIRRHRHAVAVAAAFVLVLAAGLLVTVRMYLQAERLRAEAGRARAVAERQEYAASIAAAEALLGMNQSADARRRLLSAPPALRGWEWRYLWADSNRSVATISSRGGAPVQVAFTLDGTQLLWISEYGVVHTADASSFEWKPGAVFPGPAPEPTPRSVIAVAPGTWHAVTAPLPLPSLGVENYVRGELARDGRNRAYLALAASQLSPLEFYASIRDAPAPPHSPPRLSAERRTLSVVDMATGDDVGRLVLPNLGLAGIHLAAPVGTKSTTVFTCDIDGASDGEGRALIRLGGRSPGATVSAAFSGDGRRVITWTWDNVLRVWEVKTGEELAALAGHQDGIREAALNQDGSMAASASHDGTVRLWSTAGSQRALVLHRADEPMSTVAFSADGSRVVAGGADRLVRIWNVDGRAVGRFEGHQDAVTAVAFAPDGRRVASGSADRTIRLWDVGESSAAAVLHGHDAALTSLAFRQDGRRLVSGSADRTVRVWDLSNTASALRASLPPGQTVSVLFWGRETGRLFAASSTAIHTWTPHLRDHVEKLRFESDEGWSDFGITEAGAAGDGHTILAGTAKGAVLLWSRDRVSEPVQLEGPHPHIVVAIAVDANGARAASASIDGTLRLWNLQSRRAMAVLRAPGVIAALAYSPDRRYFASNRDRDVLLRDPDDGAVIRTMTGHEDVVVSLAFTPDARLVASASRDGTVRLWDVQSGASRGVLKGNGRPVAQVVFDPTGQRIASASEDGTISIWETGSGEALLVFDLHRRESPSILFTPDGSSLLAATTNGQVGILSTVTAYPADVAPSNERDDPDVLVRAAWAVVREAGRGIDEYQRALTAAEHAVRLAPYRREYLDVLAAALYRAGRFEDGLAAAARGTALRGRPNTEQLAFGALCNARLGRVQAARAAVAGLRTAASRMGQMSADEERWLAEAEALLGEKR